MPGRRPRKVVGWAGLDDVARAGMRAPYGGLGKGEMRGAGCYQGTDRMTPARMRRARASERATAHSSLEMRGRAGAEEGVEIGVLAMAGS